MTELNLQEIKDKLDKAKEERTRCEERLKAVEKEKEELLGELKELGLKSFDEIEPELEKVKKEIEGIMKEMDNIDIEANKEESVDDLLGGLDLG